MHDSGTGLRWPVSLGLSQAESQADTHFQQADIELLYTTRRPELLRYLVKFGLDFAEAEDVVQEVFLKCFVPPDLPRGPVNLFRWLLTCARNLAISRYRHRRRERLAPLHLWERWEKTLSDGAAMDAEASIQEKQTQTRLGRALATLSSVEQQCLVLRSRGMTFREMACELNLPMQRAVYTTDVAIQKLQRKLKLKHSAP